ncbi:2,3-dihydroxy-p-cumate/2,3-dihydroxybenzoate 3,4-dioxygenase [Sphingomonas vulcanisoli]|uniref:2,3-dihydroxy-p-cumate/2,3-dihydroxybenzoate 3,4-dioxygenase n=1 Tax=Sphingomonas vulcanisoli TaxID=1658060 RepID=A0ABX0TVR8_9SPHN|nr:VOC family protein [Sphingomonas vulcanisoli]NIJ09637.1 2,3-dihydroxy-p-cumate/2,3-dihydroxybenzoate 3,4-dioxygenase [Sphingomonas vulcanisoli]
MTDFRYRRLKYVAVVVTDVERTENFLLDIVGLAEGPESGKIDTRFLRCSDDHHDVILIKGREPGLARISFEMESVKDFDATKAHLTKKGLNPVDVDADELAFLGIDRAFRIIEPNSKLTFEFMHGMVAAETPFVPTVADISMLGHIVLMAKDVDAVTEFLINTLNFKLSDEGAGGGLLRPFPTTNHHSLGLVRSNENRIGHIAFMVHSYDVIGKAVPRFKKHDVPIVFGPGHHPASNSNFLYFLDPDGITWEYTFGMEQFPEHDPRDPRYLELGNGDSWGNEMDPRMGKVGRVVTPDELVS